MLQGYFEFYLCNVDSLGGAEEATIECLHENKLINADNNRTRTDFLIDSAKTYVVRLQLPPGLSCDHCVLQWRWRTGEMSKIIFNSKASKVRLWRT